MMPPWPANIIEKIVALAIGGNSQGTIIRLRRNLARKKRRLKYEAMAETDAELEDDGQHQENRGVHQGCAGDWVVYLDLVVVEPDKRPAPGDEAQVFDAHREAVDERVGEEDDHVRESGQDESEQDRVPAVRSAANATSVAGRVGLAPSMAPSCRGRKPRPP